MYRIPATHGAGMLTSLEYEPNLPITVDSSPGGAFSETKAIHADRKKDMSRALVTLKRRNILRLREARNPRTVIVPIIQEAFRKGRRPYLSESHPNGIDETAPTRLKTVYI